MQQAGQLTTGTSSTRTYHLPLCALLPPPLCPPPPPTPEEEDVATTGF